jgi:dihydrofolate reductase
VPKLIYSMGVSLDGFIAARDGSIDWSAPDEELHAFHNLQARETGVHLYGRRLWEEMQPWETVDRDPTAPKHMAEFSKIWKATPKLVFSTTLETVGGNARLLRHVSPEDVAQLKEGRGKQLAVGGAGLAASFIRLGLVDEFHLFISPVVLGGGTPYWPELDERINLELLETRTFASRVVYVRYRRLRDA